MPTIDLGVDSTATLPLESMHRFQNRQKFAASGPVEPLVNHAAPIPTVGVWSQLQVLGQAHLTYLICQNDDGVVLVDQHAAHERVMFEQIMADWRDGKVAQQMLLMPLVLDLSQEETEILSSQAHDLLRFGIQVEKLAVIAVGFRAVPCGFSEDGVVSGVK